jgi:hypothetical protein
MRLIAIGVVAVALAGCGGGGHATTGPAIRPTTDSIGTIKTFLYSAQPRDCPQLWAPNAQRACAALVRRVIVARHRHEIPPHIAARDWQVSESADRQLTVYVGNRQPNPVTGIGFHATFELGLYGGKWKIERLG